MCPYLILIISAISIVNSESVWTKSVNLTKQCVKDWREVLRSARDGDLWAIRMLDSATKLPDGLLWKNVDQLGNWKECTTSRPPNRQYVGRYCRAVFTSVNETGHETFLIRAATCFPSSCTPLDIEQIIMWVYPAFLGQLYNIDLNLTAHVDPLYCTTKGQQWHTIGIPGWFFATYVVAHFIFLIVLTVLEYFGKYPDSFEYIIELFSIRGAFKRLFDTRPVIHDVACIHGMRVLSMLWLVLGHRHQVSLYVPTSNNLQVFDEFLRKPSMMTVLNFHLAIDTFLFLSGYLTFHTFMRDMGHGIKFNLVPFYLYRIFRCFIPIAVMVIYYVTFISHAADGPNWEPLVGARLRNNCHKNWWVTLLFVNNYINVFEPCLSQTWYVSVAMQLTLLSPMVLLPLYYLPNAGRQLLVFITIISCLIPFGVTYVNNYPWSVDVVNRSYDYDGFYRDVYLPTHTRATPYVFGILAAHFIANYKQPMSKVMVTIGWSLNTALCLAVVYCLAIPYQEGYQHNPLSASFYAGFHRLGWSLGLSWIILSCERGIAGPIASILTWHAFLPLSKLSFSTYLSYVAITLPIAASYKTTEYSHPFTLDSSNRRE